MRCLFAIIILCAAAAHAAPGGYGRFAWGASVAAVQKIEPKLQAFPQAEPVAFEAQALDRIFAAEREAVRKSNRKARRAFQRPKRAPSRLAAFCYWVTIEGLSGRVELRFADDQLYEVILRVLYRDNEKPAAGKLLDLLIEKYGAPLEPPEGPSPVGERPRLDFALADGTLQVLRRRADPKRRGLLRLHYRSAALADPVERYLDGLRGRLSSIEQAAHPPKPPPPDPAQVERERALQHL
ncbi:MAG: hypothetical protein KC620_20390 [Myxococcales bacterium]|nr:hypothetical protein [Myxococcales bacterium]